MIYKQYKLVLAQFYGFIGLIMIAVLSTSVKVEIDAILIWFLSVIFTIAILFFVYNRMWVWFDGIFIILSPFYFYVSFLLYYFFGVNVFNVENNIINTSFLYCVAVWCIVASISLIRPHGINIFLLNKQYNYDNNYNLFIPSCIAWLISLFFLYQSRNLSLNALGESTRLELINSVSQSGWYLKYVVIAYFWILLDLKIVKKSLTNYSFVIYSIPVLLYFYTLMLVGSRREIALSFIMAVLLSLYKAKFKIPLKVALFSILFVSTIILFGIYRSDYNVESSIRLLNALGEFIYPISTLQYYSSIHYQTQFFGISYLQFIVNFIPKELFMGLKPDTLAIQFAKEVYLPSQEFMMGYAFTPFTEAFINYNYYGVIIFPAILCGYSYIMERLIGSNYFLYLVFLSQSINFQRSEFSSMIFELGMFFMAYICLRLSMQIVFFKFK
ncbi:O125 family O-antigen polymerase [Escherichia coli]|uniref:O-antigen polymerase n=1 Tax=Escherichia coli TaxID=562 RepID=UPI00184EB8ED|nr:O-antigen polymerase [Escherichia coli]EFH3834197.1 O125 family O-antigen polymerase [Escherichia coli]EHT2163340.1 O125 family O-antigen polymerase [Escherichia coli]EIY4690492.1 O125 family O-antigen polymerase [Escherichia coli]EJI8370525.1 O125 family O-antigen polymerase [Escherichia coli]EKO0630972.1 O125 family O-antigen polymerase [Escherichia coli]